jgi:predicted dehydrogenase
MLRIGIVGAGNAARNIHLPGFRLCPDAEVAVVCDADGGAAQVAGAAETSTDYRSVCRRPDIDAVVVATPNFLHREMVLAALESGKHVLCEKPLALNRKDAEAMLAAADRTGRVHMTAFTYRFTPAIRFAKHLIERGELGPLRTVRAAYLMALSGHVLGWRSLKQMAGAGVLADIGSHLVDLVELLAGGVQALTASERRFRDDPASDVEDWIAFLAEFESGARGTFEISRVAPGRGAGISEEVLIELYGVSGSIVFSLQDPWGLMAALGEDGRDPTRPLRHYDVPQEFLKLSGSPRDTAADDRRWGYRYDQAFQFVESVKLGRSRAPSFADGARCQAVLDAALASVGTRRWVQVA